MLSQSSPRHSAPSGSPEDARLGARVAVIDARLAHIHHQLAAVSAAVNRWGSSNGNGGGSSTPFTPSERLLAAFATTTGGGGSSSSSWSWGLRSASSGGGSIASGGGGSAGSAAGAAAAAALAVPSSAASATPAVAPTAPAVAPAPATPGRPPAPELSGLLDPSGTWDIRSAADLDARLGVTGCGEAVAAELLRSPGVSWAGLAGFGFQLRMGLGLGLGLYLGDVGWKARGVDKDLFSQSGCGSGCWPGVYQGAMWVAGTQQKPQLSPCIQGFAPSLLPLRARRDCCAHCWLRRPHSCWRRWMRHDMPAAVAAPEPATAAAPVGSQGLVTGSCGLL